MQPKEEEKVGAQKFKKLNGESSTMTISLIRHVCRRAFLRPTATVRLFSSAPLPPADEPQLPIKLSQQDVQKEETNRQRLRDVSSWMLLLLHCLRSH